MNDQPETTALAETGPMSLLRLAVEKGAGADELEKLAALAERLEANRAKAAFAAAMNACQAEMTTIIRDKVNAQINKKYAPLETIKTWAKPHFIKHGFSLSFTAEAGQEVTRTTVHLDVTHIGGHTQRSTIPNCELDDKGPKGGDVKTAIQGRMSMLSYAQGRLICLAFNLTVADEDRDGQANPAASEGILAEQVAELNALTLAAWPAEKPRLVNIERHIKWVATASKRDVAAFDQFDQEQFRLSKTELLAIIAERNKPK